MVKKRFRGRLQKAEQSYELAVESCFLIKVTEDSHNSECRGQCPAGHVFRHTNSHDTHMRDVCDIEFGSGTALCCLASRANIQYARHAMTYDDKRAKSKGTSNPIGWDEL